MRSLVLLSAIALLICSGAATAAVILVPADSPTIGGAVALAAAGDTIVVAPGTYAERDIEVVCPLTITSSLGHLGGVTVDAGGEGRHFAVWSLPLTLRGLHLTGGHVPDDATHLSGGSIRIVADGVASVDHCVFDSNYAPWRGGAIYIHVNVELVISDCGFVENSIGFNNLNGPNGGAIFSERGTLEAQRCNFIRNVAGPGCYVNSSGGAVMCGYGPATFTECLFEENEATPGYNAMGGAFWGQAGVFELVDCTFIANQAPEGGAVYSNVSTVTLRGCSFFGNISDREGGAVGLKSCEAVLFSGCTLAGNQTSSEGGAIGGDGSNLVLESCTLTGNRGGDGAVYSEGVLGLIKTVIVDSELARAVAGPADADVSCSCLYGNDLGDWTGPVGGFGGVNGNFSADPLFCAPGNDDFTLHLESPCAPPGITDCGLVGALPVNCGMIPVEEVSWGRVKSQWR